MPIYKVFYYNKRDKHRLMTEYCKALTIWGVCRKFLDAHRGLGDIYLSCIKVKMPVIKGGKK